MATFHFVPLVHSAFPINPWLARFACVALRKVVPKLDPSQGMGKLSMPVVPGNLISLPNFLGMHSVQ